MTWGNTRSANVIGLGFRGVAKQCWGEYGVPGRKLGQLHARQASEPLFFNPAWVIFLLPFGPVVNSFQYIGFSFPSSHHPCTRVSIFPPPTLVIFWVCLLYGCLVGITSQGMKSNTLWKELNCRAWRENWVSTFHFVLAIWQLHEEKTFLLSQGRFCYTVLVPGWGRDRRNRMCFPLSAPLSLQDYLFYPVLRGQAWFQAALSSSSTMDQGPGAAVTRPHGRCPSSACGSELMALGDHSGNRAAITPWLLSPGWPHAEHQEGKE